MLCIELKDSCLCLCVRVRVCNVCVCALDCVGGVQRDLLRSVTRQHKAWASMALCLFLNRAYNLTKNNVGLLQLLDKSSMEQHILRFKPPSRTLLDKVRSVTNSCCRRVLCG